MSEFYIIQRKDQVENLKNNLLNKLETMPVISVDVKNGKRRTSQQQAALEVWCRNTAEFFNEAGITREIRSSIFKEGSFECDWTRDSVKNEVWRPVQVALTQKESTTDQSTSDYAKTYDTLVRAFGTKGLSLPAWPVKHD